MKTRARKNPEPPLLVSPDLYVDGNHSRYAVCGGRYVGVRFPGAKKWVYEHHLAMEAILGRPMDSHEEVHHLNGDGTDNRPENLELWYKSQPPGVRASDAVEMAIKTLLRNTDLLVANESWQNLARIVDMAYREVYDVH